MTIPVEDHAWHWVDVGEVLPEGHRAEAAQVDDGFVVRITGPSAHVLGQGPMDAAIEAAMSWFARVGREL
jgi:hypothetical protein